MKTLSVLLVLRYQFKFVKIRKIIHAQMFFKKHFTKLSYATTFTKIPIPVELKRIPNLLTQGLYLVRNVPVISTITSKC